MQMSGDNSHASHRTLSKSESCAQIFPRSGFLLLPIPRIELGRYGSQEWYAMTARLSSRPTLSITFALILLTTLFTPIASARTREVLLGDPDIGDQGPAPAPPKSLKASSIQLNRPNAISLNQWRMLIRIALALGIRTL